jgi:uncharacterized membrane protein
MSNDTDDEGGSGWALLIGIALLFVAGGFASVQLGNKWPIVGVAAAVGLYFIFTAFMLATRGKKKQ